MSKEGDLKYLAGIVTEVQKRLGIIGKSYITPEQFGAIGDGVADDTTALENAYIAAKAAHRSIYIPAGTYRFTHQLVWDCLSGVVNVKGDGVESTVLMKDGNFDGIKIESYGACFDNFAVSSLGGADVSAGISGSWMARCSLSSIIVRDQGGIGIHILGGDSGSMRDVTASGNGSDGIRFTGFTGLYPAESCNAWTFLNVSTNANGAYGLNLAASNSNALVNHVAHLNTLEGLRLHNAYNNVIGYYEGNKEDLGDILIDATSIGNLISLLNEPVLITDNGSSNIIIYMGEIKQQSWIAPTLLNSWVNFSASYASAGYFKDSLGIVHLQGMVSDGTIGQAIFQLPVGYRPPYIYRQVSGSYDGANYAHTMVSITTGGDVIALAGGNDWFSLNGITFKVV